MARLPLIVAVAALPLALAAVLGSCSASIDPSLEGTLAASLPEPVEAVVPVVRVVAGQPDTLALADLLGADVRAQFGRDPDVAVERLGADSVVVVARPGFAGLATVPFAAGGVDYALAVQAEVWPEVTLSFAPPADRLLADLPPEAPRPEVAVIGDLTAGAPALLDDPDGDGTQERTFALAPGTYRYRLVVDGDTIADPANPETVADTAGVAYSVLTVAPPASGRLHLRLVGLDAGDPRRLSLAVHRMDADGRPVPVDVDKQEGVVVLDDNRLIGGDAVDARYDEVTLNLAAAASGPRTLRLAVRAHGLVSNWIEVPLLDRRPAEG